jgi:hypothetical protein
MALQARKTVQQCCFSLTNSQNSVSEFGVTAQKMVYHFLKNMGFCSRHSSCKTGLFRDMFFTARVSPLAAHKKV